MNVFHRVAQRSMRANRMRTIVTIIGVILSAAMFTAVTTFATTLMTHLQRVTAYLDGAYYLGVHNVDADTLASMRADSDIEAFSTAEVLGYAEVTVNNSNKPYLYVEAIDAGFSDRMPVHLVEGRMPENSTELLIPDHLQAYSDEQGLGFAGQAAMYILSGVIGVAVLTIAFRLISLTVKESGAHGNSRAA